MSDVGMERRAAEIGVPEGLDRLERALVYAKQLHAGHVRKGTAIPYYSHLLGVAALVMEHGGTEDEVIAALLHDAVEDRGGLATLADIGRRFGPGVAATVEACSDSHETPKPPWRERKERYLAHLATSSAKVLRVSAADKVHNARAILADYRAVGDEVWSRFNAGRDDVLWYYRSMADLLSRRAPGGLADELTRVVSELDDLVHRAGVVTRVKLYEKDGATSMFGHAEVKSDGTLEVLACDVGAAPLDFFGNEDYEF